MAVSTITITATRSGTPSTVVINRGPAGPAGDAGGGVDSYVDDIESLVDYPATFPPDAHTQATSTITGLDTALALLAPKANPTFTGIFTQPTGSTFNSGAVNVSLTADAVWRNALGLGTGDAATFASLTTETINSSGSTLTLSPLYTKCNRMAFGGTGGSNPMLLDGGSLNLKLRSASNTSDANLILGNLTASGTVKTGVYTVTTLPTPSAGMRAYVSDANATTYLSIVAAGGANVVPVFYNGTNWVIA